MGKSISLINRELKKLWNHRDKDWQEELETSLRLYQEALSIDYTQGIIGALIVQANSYSWLDNIQDAFAVLDKASDFLTSEPITPWSVRLHFVYGTLYRNFSDFDQALEHYLIALKQAEILKAPEEIALANGNVAMMYLYLQEYEKAIEGLQQILNNEQILSDTNRLFTAYLNLATAYYHQKDSELAIRMATNALKIASTEISKIKAHGNLGAAYLINGDLDEAKIHLTISYDLAIKAGDPFTQCISSIDLADFFIETQDVKRSVDTLQRALFLAQSTSNKQGMRDCHQRLYSIYRQQDDWENALFHHENFSRIDKEIFNENSDKRIRNLEVLHRVNVLRESERKLSKKVSEQTVELQHLISELEQAYETTLQGWAQALEFRDRETEGHSRRVTDLAITIGKDLGFSEEKLRHLYYGALLHDIGKMGIPDDILNKSGPLTQEEREVINQHPVYAYELLKKIRYLQPAIAIPYSHHENWDGTGYPQGLKGEEIPLEARIFSIIDHWDALTSDRPYRKTWSQEKTIEYIKSEKGKKFDPQLVDIVLDKLA